MSFQPTPFRLPAFMLTQAPTELHRFVGENLPALAFAATILGGSSGRQLLARLVEELQSETIVTSSAQRSAAQLSHVLDPDGSAWRGLTQTQGIDEQGAELTEMEQLLRVFHETLAQM
ncbi:hypothetical protein [Pseudoprimorskyibacter insulae]|uniref:Uncharacterized protein n=1 Tax=Pseudoprimorskyibacter insulae TaxID=1695997 RepID=A0A2R8APU3_9RHOB|nr:hypothetical protein [Pseudoprimorskyibacter insulae]SPF78096.1 hypothetical protein PRI8871_00687 [Pseudoprimorskyibacter insulae]